MSTLTPRRIVVLSAAYSLHSIRQRKIEFRIQAQALDGYFEHAWLVNALVGADATEPFHNTVGKPTYTELAPGHTIVEGKVGRFRALHRVAPLNLLIAQAQLFLQISRLVRRERVTVIRVDDPFYHGLMGLVLGRLHRIPVEVRLVANYDELYEMYGDLQYPRLLRSWRVVRSLGRFVLKRADMVTAGSDNGRAYALSNGVQPQRLGVARNGNMIDPVHQRPTDQRRSVSDELGLAGRPFVVSLGRLEAAKSPDHVVRVLAEAQPHVRGLAAVFIGDGSLRADLDRLVDSLGLRADVVFAGERDQEWISNALASADVIVSPLTGLALVEAALSGTPIVAYDVDWQPEFIATGKTGVIVPYNDITAMAAAICRLIQSPAEARRLGSAARAHALNFQDPSLQTENERAQYERLFSQVAARRAVLPRRAR